MIRPIRVLSTFNWKPAFERREIKSSLADEANSHPNRSVRVALPYSDIKTAALEKNGNTSPARKRLPEDITHMPISVLDHHTTGRPLA
jgi:hypothetical protein